jgi:hypothetical protein
MTVVETARAFGLADDGTIYRSIARMEADAIATHVLQAELAHGSKIMSGSRAAHLWEQFMALFDGQDVKFATNAAALVSSWTPATRATFDMGVLVIGVTRVGCLWVEDED